MQHVITSITVQKKNPNRFNIFINRHYSFSLNRQHAEHLKPGDELSQNRIADLKQADEEDAAYSRALFYLKFRPRSRMEIKRYLVNKEFPPNAISSALSRLEDNAYINDHEFARLWVENRLRFKPRGLYALKGELREKGIDAHIIKEVLMDLDEQESAWAAAAPRAARLKNLEKPEFTKKLYNFLSRRGFGYSIAREICDRAWKENSATDRSEDK